VLLLSKIKGLGYFKVGFVWQWAGKWEHWMWKFVWVTAVLGFNGLYFPTNGEDEEHFFTRMNASVVATLLLPFGSRGKLV
jgi:hypothetical protein